MDVRTWRGSGAASRGVAVGRTEARVRDVRKTSDGPRMAWRDGGMRRWAEGGDRRAQPIAWVPEGSYERDGFGDRPGVITNPSPSYNSLLEAAARSLHSRSSTTTGKGGSTRARG